MAPNYRIFDNPLTLYSRKAMRVLGRLIAQWSVDAASRPKTARIEADGRILVLSAADLRALLAAQPGDDALGDQDYRLRDDVTEIELVLRRPGRAVLLLPEPEAIAFQAESVAQGLVPAMHLPKLFGETGSSSDWVPTGDPNPGNFPALSAEDEGVTLVKFQGDNPLDAFLNPYMAAYACTQCT